MTFWRDLRYSARSPSRSPGLFAALLFTVTGVVWTSHLPGARTSGRDLELQLPSIGNTEAVIDTITSGGAEALAQERVSGRMFGGVDSEGTCPVAIANGAAAQKYFGGNALGRQIADGADRRIDIVGVVRPRPTEAADEPGLPPQPTLYFYDRQAPAWAAEDVIPRRFRIPILPDAAAPHRVSMAVTIASPGYLHAMGATLLAGTEFAGIGGASCGVALINREGAAAHFAGKPIGGAAIDRDGQRARIVGVIESPVLRVVERSVEPTLYLPFEQVYSPAMTLIAQTETAAPELVAQIDAALQGLDGDAKAPKVMTLEERLLRTALGPERIATTLVAACAALALALALIGVYGVMSDTVRARQREIALRLALGAPAWRIVYGVFSDGVRLASVGAAAGMAMAWILVRFLLHADDGFPPPPAWIWAVCPAVLFAMVAVASVGPARWALAVNPLAIARQG